MLQICRPKARKRRSEDLARFSYVIPYLKRSFCLPQKGLINTVLGAAT